MASYEAGAPMCTRNATKEMTSTKISIMLHLPSESSHMNALPRFLGCTQRGGANQRKIMIKHLV